MPSGFGASTLDCIGSYCGVSFVIETKAPGGKLTNRQQAIADQMTMAGYKLFIIDGTPETDTLEELEAWLRSMQLFFGK